MIDNILHIRFSAPYNGTICFKRKRAFSMYRRQPGIYLIKEGEQIVYVGMSKNCAVKACYRHFEEWNDPRCKRTVYTNDADYSIIILPVSSHQVEGFERALICCLHPRDNKNKFSFIGEKELETVEEDELPF